MVRTLWYRQLSPFRQIHQPLIVIAETDLRIACPGTVFFCQFVSLALSMVQAELEAI